MPRKKSKNSKKAKKAKKVNTTPVPKPKPDSGSDSDASAGSTDSTKQELKMAKKIKKWADLMGDDRVARQASKTIRVRMETDVVDREDGRTYANSIARVPELCTVKRIKMYVKVESGTSGQLVARLVAGDNEARFALGAVHSVGVHTFSASIADFEIKNKNRILSVFIEPEDSTCQLSEARVCVTLELK